MTQVVPHRAHLLPLLVGATLIVAACGDEDSTPVATPDAGAVVDMGTPDLGSPDMGVEPECATNAECSSDTPYCDTAAGACAAPPRGGAIGWGDGSPTSVSFELVHASMRAAQATDVEFSNVNPDQLWVLHREVPSTAPCTQRLTSGCFALQGSTTTIFDPATPEQREDWIQDFNAWHFMRRPPAIAFGVQGYFATCGEERTGNYLDSSADFIGPTLWTSDPSIYRNYTRSEYPQGWNGTHMDMLHASPFCMGIAHDRGNAYWVANGQIGSLDWYDFVDDHGPGQADHSDGLIRRYATGTLTRVPFVPGHLAVHDGRVYAADTGGGRIIAFDPTGATPAGPIVPQYEPLAESTTFTGGTVIEIVPPGGVLQQPSGLEIHDGLMYVTDHATGQFHVFELDGTLVRSLDSGLGRGHLAGIALSPDGMLYYVDLPRSAVFRIVPF